jgi:hypothetical protein
MMLTSGPGWVEFSADIRRVLRRGGTRREIKKRDHARYFGERVRVGTLKAFGPAS